MKLPFTPTWNKVAAQKREFLQFLYIFEKDVRREWKKKSYDGLNEGRGIVLRIYWLITELNNGGLDQYFWNFSGDFTEETILDLRTIGTDAAADVLLRATNKLFGSEGAPRKTRPRRQAIESYYGTHPFNDDDNEERLVCLEGKENLEAETRELDELQKPLMRAIMSWIMAHADQFSHIKE